MHEANQIVVRLALVVGGCTAMVASDDNVRRSSRARWHTGNRSLPVHSRRVQLAYGERLRRARMMVEARVQFNEAVGSSKDCARNRRWTAPPHALCKGQSKHAWVNAC